MSTVIWYKGVLYSDSQVSNGDIINESGETIPKIIKKGKKLFRANNTLYGVTGTLEGYANFVKRGYKGSWYWSITPFWFALIIQWDGKKLITWKLIEKKIFGIYFSWFKKSEIEWNSRPKLILFMGSGSEYAMEADNKRLIPEEMIQYASDRDPYTDDDVVSMNLSDLT